MPERRIPNRRALSHVGGRVTVRGSNTDAERGLREALEVPGDDPEARAHVHGFHSYAARLHPETARRLIARCSDDGAVILDPFMGSGTVLVEARLLGRRAIGRDLNPLAVELTHLKTRGTTADERAGLLSASRRVVEHAEERRTRRSGPTAPYGRADRELFDVHMLLELDGLKDGIVREEALFERKVLELVLSSILVKASRRPGDTADRVQPRRLASGFAIRLFAKKTEELALRLEDFQGRLPNGAPPCDVAVDDARRLPSVPKQSVDLVVSSPPYPGVYDYARHHETRLRWLGMDGRELEKKEIGSRRELAALSAERAIARWRDDFGESLGAIGRTLRPRGRAVLILADSTIGGRPHFVDDTLFGLAESAGFRVEAVASQVRPHFHDEDRGAFSARPRREHAFLLALRGR